MTKCDNQSCDYGFAEELDILFKELNTRSIRYCVLRGYTDLPHRIEGSDVDCICLPEDRLELHTVFGQLGYFPVKHPQHPQKVILYSKYCADGWLTLSIAFTLLPSKYCEMSGIRDVLSRRIPYRSFYVQHPDDEFVHILLHCVAKGVFKPTHAAQIARLSSLLEDASGVKRTLGSRGLAWGDVIDAVSSGSLDNLLDYRSTVLASFGIWAMIRFVFAKVRARRYGKALRAASELYRYFAHPNTKPRTLRIAILGLDGSGKSTVIAGLGERFPAVSSTIPTARIIYLGGKGKRWPLNYSVSRRLLALLGSWLSGRVWDLHLYTRKFLRNLKAVVRFPPPALLISDRSFYDTLVKRDMQPGIIPRAWSDRWVYLLFHKLAVQPHIVVFIDIPIEESLRRKGEHNHDYLSCKKRLYDQWLGFLGNTSVVDGLKPPHEVVQDVVSIIQAYYVESWG